jgi:DNA repair exonuclease SbcCD ATPase subunit
VALFSRRPPEPVSIEGEQERLRAIRMAAEEELGRLRRELTERVQTVENKERELADTLARIGRAGSLPPGTNASLAHAHTGLAAHAQALNRRERELAARERAYLRMEADLQRRAAEGTLTSEERIEKMEARLASLQEAERQFAKSQAELAAVSDELALREAELQERERALGGGALPGMSRQELAELDERLSRLERETREASADRSFSDGLRKLERKGVRGTPPA